MIVVSFEDHLRTIAFVGAQRNGWYVYFGLFRAVGSENLETAEEFSCFEFILDRVERNEELQGPEQLLLLEQPLLEWYARDALNEDYQDNHQIWRIEVCDHSHEVAALFENYKSRMSMTSHKDSLVQMSGWTVADPALYAQAREHQAWVHQGQVSFMARCSLFLAQLVASTIRTEGGGLVV